MAETRPTRLRWRRSAVAIAGVIAVALVSACAGSTPKADGSTAPTEPGATATTPDPSGSSTTVLGGGATPTTSATGSPPGTTAGGAGGAAGSSQPCTSAQLALKLVDSGQSRVGYTDWLFELRNTTVTPCTMAGYPTLQLLDGTRRSIPTLEERGVGPLLSGRPTAQVLLPAGGAAVFGIEVYACPAGTSPQTAASELSVIPPDDTVPLVTAVTPMIATCPGGLVVTSPVRSDPSGLPT